MSEFSNNYSEFTDDELVKYLINIRQSKIKQTVCNGVDLLIDLNLCNAESLYLLY